MNQDAYRVAKEFLATRGLVKFADKPEVLMAMIEYGDWRVKENLKCSAGKQNQSCATR